MKSIRKAKETKNTEFIVKTEHLPFQYVVSKLLWTSFVVAVLIVALVHVDCLFKI